MERMMVTECEVAAVRPRYGSIGAALLDEIRLFFEDPRNEAEFQAWKRCREEKAKQDETA